MQNNRGTAEKAKGIVHVLIGIVYMVIGATVIYANNNKYIDIDNVMAYILCGLFTVYGLFRIYRGYLRIKGKAIGW